MRKYRIGDVVFWWSGQRRVVQRIRETKHGGHCYYGLRILKSVARSLPVRYTNVGFDGRADKTRIYWVRSDRLAAFDGAANRTGEAGRPKLIANKGRRRSSRMDTCPFCGGPKYKVSKTCNGCRWRLLPTRGCSSCGKRKSRRADICATCYAAQSRVSPQTLAILEALERDAKYGRYARVARQFGLTRARVSAIAGAHREGWKDAEEKRG